jgi:hypothetical protein
MQQVKVMGNAEPQQWFDCNTVANATSISCVTVRHLLLTFFKFALLERAEVFGGYRYRLSPTADTQPYFLRVQEATAVIQQ